MNVITDKTASKIYEKGVALHENLTEENAEDATLQAEKYASKSISTLNEKLSTSSTFTSFRQQSASFLSSTATGLAELASRADTNINIIRAELLQGEGEGDK